ncbi:cysteine peptidase family C39 domain-containing protein [Prevotella sp.]|uniref:cysteine peptidase family C39 domain-containing protein n=1 Tax=Prevotella sp. TaxID=59823 RepID=UPI003FEFF03B
MACLASICEYYGKKYSTQFISKLCSCTPTGISLQSLKLAAEQFDHVIIFPS